MATESVFTGWPKGWPELPSCRSPYLVMLASLGVHPARNLKHLGPGPGEPRGGTVFWEPDRPTEQSGCNGVVFGPLECRYSYLGQQTNTISVGPGLPPNKRACTGLAWLWLVWAWPGCLHAGQQTRPGSWNGAVRANAVESLLFLKKKKNRSRIVALECKKSLCPQAAVQIPELVVVLRICVTPKI